MPALTTRQQAATFRLINETVRDRLVAQRDAIDRIETKGTVLLGFSIAAAQLYVTQSVSISELRIVCLVAFGLAVVFGLFVVRPYEHRYPPEPSDFYGGFLDTPAHIVEKWLAGARTIAFEANVPLAKRKERFYWLMLAALLAAALLSILSFTL
jgi:hypothetical protein